MNINQYDIVLDVLVVNQTADTLQVMSELPSCVCVCVCVCVCNSPSIAHNLMKLNVVYSNFD